MRFYQRIIGISWTENVINIEAMCRIGERNGKHNYIEKTGIFKQHIESLNSSILIKKPVASKLPEMFRTHLSKQSEVPPAGSELSFQQPTFADTGFLEKACKCSFGVAAPQASGNIRMKISEFFIELTGGQYVFANFKNAISDFDDFERILNVHLSSFENKKSYKLQ